ncbi:ArsR/SmtB family transcription factor [Haloarcula sp. GH36]|uniref:ArsR/SmtB family transcription factor n=1 Tax=Haloarcula montana TaxID=3111776 RepID=UPI002D779407|nr:winged helix-turn-helix domain-containing protein [Haloarcula sp. GH36]
MSNLLPQKPPVDRPEPEARIINLGEGDTDEVFSVLGSDIARTALAELYRSPATQSELAERVGTSIQNVGYHLDQLVGAGLVTIVDQWYSENGMEMDVFAPDSDPLILVAGDHDQKLAVDNSATCSRVDTVTSSDD